MKNNSNYDDQLAHLDASELVDENPGYDEIRIREVATNGDVTLCEYNRDDNDLFDDFSVDPETIHSLFPDVELDESKGYVIIKDDVLYTS